MTAYGIVRENRVHIGENPFFVDGLGPVVQSIISLAKSLVNDSLNLINYKKKKKRCRAPYAFQQNNGSIFAYNTLAFTH